MQATPQDSIGIESILDRALGSPLFGKAVVAIVGVLVFLVLARVVRRSLGRYVRDDRSRYRARKVISFVGFVITIIFLSIVFSENLGGLTVAFGVAGAGIAFALQEVIVSFAGWVAISFGDIYKTGDRVRLAGVVGDVIDVSVIRTTLMECGEWVDGDLYNGRVVRIANSFVFKEPIFNYSGDFPFLWDEITVPIRYGSDVDETRSLLKQCADTVVGDYARGALRVWSDIKRKYLVESASVEPLVTIRPDENWITFTVRYVVDFKRRRRTKDELFSAILSELEKSGGRISVASASQEITLMTRPDIKSNPVSND